MKFVLTVFIVLILDLVHVPNVVLTHILLLTRLIAVPLVVKELLLIYILNLVNIVIKAMFHIMASALYVQQVNIVPRDQLFVVLVKLVLTLSRHLVNAPYVLKASTVLVADHRYVHHVQLVNILLMMDLLCAHPVTQATTAMWAVLIVILVQ